jgi:hypothetical protein
VNTSAIVLFILSVIFLLVTSFLKTEKLKLSYRVILKLLSIFSVIYLMILATGFHVFFLGKEYNYKNLPSNLQKIVNEFEEEALKRKVNIDKLPNTKFIYLNWDLPIAPYSGLCDMKNNIIYLPGKHVLKTTLFHELGHCLFGLNHATGEANKDQIMYYQSPASDDNLSTEILDNFFFSSKTTN